MGGMNPLTYSGLYIDVSDKKYCVNFQALTSADRPLVRVESYLVWEGGKICWLLVPDRSSLDPACRGRREQEAKKV